MSVVVVVVDEATAAAAAVVVALVAAVTETTEDAAVAEASAVRHICNANCSVVSERCSSALCAVAGADGSA